MLLLEEELDLVVLSGETPFVPISGFSAASRSTTVLIPICARLNKTPPKYTIGIIFVILSKDNSVSFGNYDWSLTWCLRVKKFTPS